jgi:hypothetical protein
MAGLPLSKTSRGFALGKFTDRYGEKCSIQKSSLATEDAIWLGIDTPKVQVENPKGPGWVDVPLPPGTLVSSRMHLTQEQVRDLLPLLQYFARTGELSFDPKDWTPTH